MLATSLSTLYTAGMATCFYMVKYENGSNGLAIITEDYRKQLEERAVPDYYDRLTYEEFESSQTFTELNAQLPYDCVEKRWCYGESSHLSAAERAVFRLHQRLIEIYRLNAIPPQPWWTFLDRYTPYHFLLSHTLARFQLEEGIHIFRPVVDYFLIRYEPSFRGLLEDYFENSPPPNNTSEKALRLTEYDGENGELFLLVDANLQVQGMTSVILSKEGRGPAAKIYGRLHIRNKVPHSIIDRFFEPATHAWCEKRGVSDIYLTVNEGHHRVLEWMSRRVGRRRNSIRPNRYVAGRGADFRSNFRPYRDLIFERNVWQYVLYSSSDGAFFLERPTKPMDAIAQEIFENEFENLT